MRRLSLYRSCGMCRNGLSAAWHPKLDMESVLAKPCRSFKGGLVLLSVVCLFIEKENLRVVRHWDCFCRCPHLFRV